MQGRNLSVIETLENYIGRCANEGVQQLISVVKSAASGSASILHRVCVHEMRLMADHWCLLDTPIIIKFTFISLAPSTGPGRPEGPREGRQV